MKILPKKRKKKKEEEEEKKERKQNPYQINKTHTIMNILISEK